MAEKLGWAFVDTDEWIVSKFGEIDKIFAERGEPYFRDLERLGAVALTGLESETVVSVGGGFVLQKENVDCLVRVGKILYLRASKETLIKRLSGDETRPLLQGGDLAVRVEELLLQRSAVYKSVSDYSVDVDEKTPAEIADEIVGLLQ